MKKELALLREHIQRRGLRDTAQREEVFRALSAAGHHQSSDELYQLLRRQGVSVGRATVFRTLKLLEECGLVAKVTFADGTQKFEPAHGRPHHDHMICLDCGTALEFHSEDIEAIQEREAKKRGFTVLWHRHELMGRCRDCQRKHA